MSKKTITIPVVCVLALALAGSVFIAIKSKEDAMPKTAALAVLMSDDGFSPTEATIHAGDRVDFVNTSTTTAYWPASDLHPTHDLYPEFDPKQPVPAGTTWSFVFKKKGDWRMHDHLHPDKRGKITVL